MGCYLRPLLKQSKERAAAGALLVGVGDFRGIAVMVTARLQWEKKSRGRFGNWFRIDFRQDGVPATPILYGAWK
jgi:hypothetical protein